MTYGERKQLLQKVEDIVGEHCEAFIFIAIVEGEDRNSNSEMVMFRYEGGRAQALGLTRQAQVMIETEIQDETRERE